MDSPPVSAVSFPASDKICGYKKEETSSILGEERKHSEQNTEIPNIITRQQQMTVPPVLLFTAKHSWAKDFSETVQGR